MQRREFMAALGGAAAWPLAALAQQGERMRRIGVLFGASVSDPEGQAYIGAFREALAGLGWTEGRNLQIDLRFGEAQPDQIRAHAAELVGLGPEVIFTVGGAAIRAVQQQTQTIPIVFTGAGQNTFASSGSFTPAVRNIARPEGNTTGFTNFYDSLAGKWLEFLKVAAPRVQRVAFIINLELSPRGPEGYFTSIQAAAPVLGVEGVYTPIRNEAELERAIEGFAAEPNGGVIIHPVAVTAHSKSIIRLTALHQLPSISSFKSYPIEGGLMSYGPDYVVLYRHAASYVDRVLRGAKVNELPVQFPTKFELVINLKTAKALGLTIPEALLATADQVIE
jgi:putative tryptophan/tyrosine transport system substrate-binding protein